MKQAFLKFSKMNIRILHMTDNGAPVSNYRVDREKGPTAEAPKGFSLMELLVVIVIIGVIAAIGTPRLLAMRPKASVRADAKDFYSAIRTAQTEAVKRSRNVCIGMVKDAGTYRVYLEGGDDLISKQLRPGNEFVNEFSEIPCFSFRGLPSNSSVESIDIKNDTLTMRVELTVAGHVRSE